MLSERALWTLKIGQEVLGRSLQSRADTKVDQKIEQRSIRKRKKQCQKERNQPGT